MRIVSNKANSATVELTLEELGVLIDSLRFEAAERSDDPGFDRHRQSLTALQADLRRVVSLMDGDVRAPVAIDGEDGPLTPPADAVRFARAFFREADSSPHGTDSFGPGDAMPPSTWFTLALLNEHDAELAWPLILTLIREARDERQLAAVGAGPLEDLVAYHPAQFGRRILDSARSDSKFQSAMRHVWRIELLAPDIQSELRGILGDTTGHD
jgi:hypothetical protein